MKTNLYIDQSTNDIALGTDLNFRFTTGIDDFVVQKIYNYLKTFAGEWFLDYTIGIPFFTRIMVKNADLNDVNSIFLAAIMSIKEVKKVLSFVTSFDKTTRTYNVNFSVQVYDNSIITNSGVIL